MSTTTTPRRSLASRELVAVEVKERRLAALDRLEILHSHMLARRGGTPIDVDAVLDEMRGKVEEA